MKARVIVTALCNRHCPNCCNQQEIFDTAARIKSTKELLAFEEVIITGGEPMLISNKVIMFLHELRYHFRYTGKIYIYTALYNETLKMDYRELLKYIDGIHYTVHFEALDKEISELRDLSQMLPKRSRLSFRLSIDTRLYGKYDFSNIDFSAWSVVRRMIWLDKCKLPDDKKLLIYDLEGAELFD
jgi:organic radical activating enzyme